MSWNALLRTAIDDAFRAAEGLLEFVEEDKLDWKPTSGQNWMTTGQLLRHLGDACGVPMRGFVTGDWGIPEGVDPSQMSQEDMIPPAERMPAVASVVEARKLLIEDKRLAFEILARCSEEELDTKPATAPWDPRPLPLGTRLLQMVDHLNSHKSQLFYYLKLQDKPVNTMHLWGV